nr:universal stress protein [Pontibacter silvestris]
MIPTDLTNESLGLIKFGLQVLKGEACQIILLHVIPLPDSITELLMLSRDEEKLEKVNTAFYKAIERIKKSYVVEIISLDVVHLYGDSPIKIQNYIDANNIDLVLCPVTASKPSAGNEKEKLRELFSDVTCPILYIPDNIENNQFRKVAYVLDPDDKHSLLLDEFLLTLTSSSDYYITFLVVFKPGTNMEKLEYIINRVYFNEKLKNMNCSVHLLQENDFTGGVYTFIEEFKVDLLVTGKKKHFLGNIFTRKRISSEVAKHTKIPFLTIV